MSTSFGYMSYQSTQLCPILLLSILILRRTWELHLTHTYHIIFIWRYYGPGLWEYWDLHSTTLGNFLTLPWFAYCIIAWYALLYRVAWQHRGYYPLFSGVESAKWNFLIWVFLRNWVLSRGLSYYVEYWVEFAVHICEMFYKWNPRS